MRHPKLPTVNIKGKEYTVVNERILYFNDTYPNGSIVTELVSPPDSKWIIVKATVTPDHATPERKFSDYSQAVVGDGYINKSAALENASTSAVGRALGMMGIGVIDAMASVDEIKKATAPETDGDPLPPQMYEDVPVIQRAVKPLPDDFRKVSEEMDAFVPLTKERNQQIQDRLQEITKNNTINRRKLSLFLEREHNGKKSFDVSATQWESTMKKIEDAIAGGEDAIKALMKAEA